MTSSVDCYLGGCSPYWPERRRSKPQLVLGSSKREGTDNRDLKGYIISAEYTEMFICPSVGEYMLSLLYLPCPNRKPGLWSHQKS